MAAAFELIGQRDAKDVPVVALAQRLKLAIWSQDRDFENLFSVSSANRISSRPAPNSRGSTMMQVSEPLDGPRGCSGIKLIPGASGSALRWNSKLARRFSTRLNRPRGPVAALVQLDRAVSSGGSVHDVAT
jgi:hypothetical protein